MKKDGTRTFTSDLLCNYAHVLVKTLREDLDLELTPDLSQILNKEFCLDIFNLERKEVLKEKLDSQTKCPQRVSYKYNNKKEIISNEKINYWGLFPPRKNPQKENYSSFSHYKYENKENLKNPNKSHDSRQKFYADSGNMPQMKYW